MFSIDAIKFYSFNMYFYSSETHYPRAFFQTVIQSKPFITVTRLIYLISHRTYFVLNLNYYI